MKPHHKLLTGALATPFLVTQGGATDSAPKTIKGKPGIVERYTDNTKVWRRADGQCYLERESSCPPGARCNPPPPRPVLCPPITPGVVETKPNGDRLIRHDDGFCYVHLKSTCKPEVKCNPPAPRQAECPAVAPRPMPTRNPPAPVPPSPPPKTK